MTPRPDEDEDLVPLPVGDHQASQPLRPGPRRPAMTARRWRDLGLGALLALLVGAGALSGIDADKPAQRPADQRPADQLPPGPGVPAASDGDEPAEPPVWTGRDALFWTGSFAGSGDGVWLYRPRP